MAAYSITATMDLKNLISEAREVAQAVNEWYLTMPQQLFRQIRMVKNEDSD